MTAPDPPARVRAIDTELVSLYARVDALLHERAWLTSRPLPAADVPAALARPVRTRETAPVTAQTVLLALGGLLLGTAAVVFTVVAWSRAGLGGRALVLLAVTVAALAAPALLLRRRLAATAETVSAIALLLCLLDAYAVRRLDLAGLGAVDGLGYAAGVLALLAAGWAGYGALLPLRGPGPTAVVLAQFPLPLLALSAGASPAGLALALLGGPALGLALGTRPATSRAVRAAAVGTGTAGWGLAVLLAAAMGFDGTEVPAAEVGVLVLAAALALAAAVLLAAGRRRDAGVGLALLVLAAAAVAAGRVPLEAAVTGGGVPLAAAVVGLLVALLAAALPMRWRRGPLGAAGVLLGLTALGPLGAALTALAVPLAVVAEPWRGVGTAPEASGLPLAVAGLVTAGLVTAALAAGPVLRSLSAPGGSGPVPPVDGPATERSTGPGSAGRGLAGGVLAGGVLVGAVAGAGGAGPLPAGHSRPARRAHVRCRGARLPRGPHRRTRRRPRPGARRADRGVLAGHRGRHADRAGCPGGAGRRGRRHRRGNRRAGGRRCRRGALAGRRGRGGPAGGRWRRPARRLPGTRHRRRRGGHGRRPAPHRPAESLAVELAAVPAAVAGVALAGTSGWTAAAAFGVLGLILAAAALRPDRRPLVYPAAVAVQLAGWIGLATADIRVPEAYTVPLSVALLAAGLLRRRVAPASSSWLAYAPGLAVTAVPSLAAALAGGTALRPLLLGAAAVGTVLLGARSRLQAPLVVGAAVLGVLAVDELGPALVGLTAELPRWLPLATGGALLLAVGSTYERRLAGLRRARDAFARLG